MNQTIFNTICGFIGAAVTFAFGEWNQLLIIFLITITIDYFSGIAASVREGSGLNSEVGFWGLAKKALMLLIVMLAHHMDLLFNADVIMSGAIYFYLANELISITENYGRIGLPLPDKVKQLISALKEKDR